MPFGDIKAERAPIGDIDAERAPVGDIDEEVRDDDKSFPRQFCGEDLRANFDDLSMPGKNRHKTFADLYIRRSTLSVGSYPIYFLIRK